MFKDYFKNNDVKLEFESINCNTDFLKTYSKNKMFLFFDVTILYFQNLESF